MFAPQSLNGLPNENSAGLRSAGNKAHRDSLARRGRACPRGGGLQKACVPSTDADRRASCYTDLGYTTCEVCVSAEDRARRDRAGMRSAGLCTPAGPRREGVPLNAFTIHTAGRAGTPDLGAQTVTGRSIAPSPDRHKNVGSPIRRAASACLLTLPSPPMGERDEGFARPGALVAGPRDRA